MKVFCTYCGAANAPDAQICTNCAGIIPVRAPRAEAAPMPPPAVSTGEAPPPSPWDPVPTYAPTQTPPAAPPAYGVGAPPPGAPPFTAWPPPEPTPQPWPAYPPAPAVGAWTPQAAGAPYTQPPTAYPPPAIDAYGQPLPPYGQPPAQGQPPAYTQAPYGQAPYGKPPSPYPMVPGPYAQAPAQPQFPLQAPGYSWAAYASGAYSYAPVPAPPGSLSPALPRFGAYLFDAVMFMVLAMVVLTVTAAIGLGGLSLLVLLALHATYHIGFWATSGRTPGYKAAGLQMIKADGSKPGLGTASIRYMGWLISPFVLYLNCLWMLWDARKQTWHDKMANTVVIKA